MEIMESSGTNWAWLKLEAIGLARTLVLSIQASDLELQNGWKIMKKIFLLIFFKLSSHRLMRLNYFWKFSCFASIEPGPKLLLSWLESIKKIKIGGQLRMKWSYFNLLMACTHICYIKLLLHTSTLSLSLCLSLSLSHPFTLTNTHTLFFKASQIKWLAISSVELLPGLRDSER